jgi:hypothetical protein
MSKPHAAHTGLCFDGRWFADGDGLTPRAGSSRVRATSTTAATRSSSPLPVPLSDPPCPYPGDAGVYSDQPDRPRGCGDRRSGADERATVIPVGVVRDGETAAMGRVSASAARRDRSSLTPRPGTFTG